MENEIGRLEDEIDRIRAEEEEERRRNEQASGEAAERYQQELKMMGLA